MGNGKVKIHIRVFGQVDSAKSTTIGEKLEKRSCQGCTERGITIDNAMRELEKDKYHFTFIDAYAHPNFMKDGMTGDSWADCALLFVDYTLGVKQMIWVSTSLEGVLTALVLRIWLQGLLSALAVG
ncbi:elongation factor 1-alpha [Ziziphus jujuba]|uniref:Elongation factor 1-alpha n=1 Tax=Ziziphus jujuba TaxID=326968 RepID=A0ABM3IPM7_ZIZJJ|nr:elongation factor 1-alpha [Ziziphus jujuba]